jgi:hypothetical protein
MDTDKKYKFETLYIIYIAGFHIKKGVRNYVYMIIWRFCYAVAMKKVKKGCDTWLQWLHAARNFKTWNLHVFGKKKSNLVKFQHNVW